MSRDYELCDHLEWIGLLQPVGLMVSPPALVQVLDALREMLAGLQAGTTIEELVPALTHRKAGCGLRQKKYVRFPTNTGARVHVLSDGA